MPARETAALLNAIEEYAQAYGGDPKFDELIGRLVDVGQTVEALTNESAEGLDSPGSQDATQAGQQAPEEAVVEVPEDAPADLPQEFQDAFARIHPGEGDDPTGPDEKKKKKSGTAEVGY